MRHATSFGGPYIFLPVNFCDRWAAAIGDEPDPSSGLYGKVCNGEDYVEVIKFSGTKVLRVGEEPSDIFWMPCDEGGFFVQWLAADTIEQLIEFAEKVVSENVWEEELVINVSESSWRLMDSCGLSDDDQPKIDVELKPGKYRVSTVCREGDSVMALIVAINRIGDLTVEKKRGWRRLFSSFWRA